MPLYDYRCEQCQVVFEVKKGMKDPDPEACPACGGQGPLERVFSNFNVGYKDRPLWTYKESLKYKHCSHDGGPRVAIDPSKHGDLASWNSPGKMMPPTQADREDEAIQKNVLKSGGYLSDAKKAVRKRKERSGKRI